jgi:hypothetical protein
MRRVRVQFPTFSKVVSSQIFLVFLICVDLGFSGVKVKTARHFKENS